MSGIRLDDVRMALALDPFDAAAAQRRMAPSPRILRRSSNQPGQVRHAGALALLFPVETGLALVLTRRTENPHDPHSGQISLPGGAQEPGEPLIRTALRETREELGIDGSIKIVGHLAPLYIPPSDFEVHPVVGWLPARPHWRTAELEVAEVLECPLDWLLDDAHKVVEDWVLGGYELRVPWYDVYGHKVWGATAIILSELEQRLRHVLPANS